MKWKHPPIIKIYEALGAVADCRVEALDNTAKVYSSTRNKFYTVTYDPTAQLIMANDNGSYWNEYLGYPAIAFLMQKGVLPYKPAVGAMLKSIPWKDINQKFKNDFEKTLQCILSSKSEEEINTIKSFVAIVEYKISQLELGLLGNKTLPPKGY